MTPALIRSSALVWSMAGRPADQKSWQSLSMQCREVNFGFYDDSHGDLFVFHAGLFSQQKKRELQIKIRYGMPFQMFKISRPNIEKGCPQNQTNRLRIPRIFFCVRNSGVKGIHIFPAEVPAVHRRKAHVDQEERPAPCIEECRSNCQKKIRIQNSERLPSKKIGELDYRLQNQFSCIDLLRSHLKTISQTQGTTEI